MTVKTSESVASVWAQYIASSFGRPLLIVQMQMKATYPAISGYTANKGDEIWCDLQELKSLAGELWHGL